jgi:hypothetical protein
MSTRTHEAVVISEFNGKWSRGEKESCPVDHSPDEKNCAFLDKGVKSRPPFSTYIDTSDSDNRAGKTIHRVHPYTISGHIDGVFIPAEVRLLVYYSDGKLFDSKLGFDDADAIFDTSGFTHPSLHVDFSVLNMNNRAYISFHFRDFGDAEIPMQVYDASDGTNVTRDALGLKPASATSSITEPSAGNVDAGQYVLAVAYETASGFITPPQAVGNRTVKTAAGAKNLQFNGIPTGPSGIVGRYLLSSKVFPTIGADVDSYELFFIPGGHIADNTTTVQAVNYFSTDLVDSAEYLKDLEETQVSVLGMCEYNGRMILWGDPNDPNSIKGSQPGKPESFQASDCSLNISVNSLGQAKRCVAFRGNLMIHKERQTKVVRDNGLEPAEWEVVDVDSSVGTEIFGVGEVYYGDSTSSDAYILADRSGIYLFNGVIQKPALTYKIEDFWLTNNAGPTAFLFNRTQVKIDPIAKIIYVSIIVTDTTQTSNLGPRFLVGDYAKGLDAKSIRWSEWNYYEDLDKSQWPANDNFIDWIQIIIDNSSLQAIVLVPDSNFANLGQIGGDATAQIAEENFTSHYSTSLVGINQDEADGIFHLGTIRARISQNTNSIEIEQCINVSITNLEENNTVDLGDAILAAQSATEKYHSEIEWLANYKDEAFRVIFSSVRENAGTKMVNSSFLLQKIRLYIKKIFNFRPLMKKASCEIHNIAPVLTVPTGDNVPILLTTGGTRHFTSDEGTAITMDDVDSGGNIEQLSLTVTPFDGSHNCNLTLTSTTGITVMSGANGTHTMVIRGTLVNINAALNNMAIHNTLGAPSDSMTLTCIANDLGNTGIGGPLTDTKTVAILLQGA